MGAGFLNNLDTHRWTVDVRMLHQHSHEGTAATKGSESSSVARDGHSFGEDEFCYLTDVPNAHLAIVEVLKETFAGFKSSEVVALMTEVLAIYSHSLRVTHL